MALETGQRALKIPHCCPGSRYYNNILHIFCSFP
jgi:hypothetical protein